MYEPIEIDLIASYRFQISKLIKSIGTQNLSDVIYY